MTLKEYALHYADMGLAVFPLKPNSKKPATVNGCKAATKDKGQITAWWDKQPDYNIGIATGSISGGLVVIDLDRDEDKGIDGYTVIKKWQQEHGNLPETAMSITGRGGYHYLYRDTAQWQNRVNLYDGVDIRGEGGYIVAPPSIHPNGHQYEWEQEPLVYGITPVDRLVVNFLVPLPADQRESFQLLEQIPEGQRTNAMVKLVCSQQAKGLSDDAIRAAVRIENEKRCVPPLTDAELEKEVLPALTRYQKGTAPYKAVPDNGKFRPAKKKDFHLDKAEDVDVKEPVWLIPGYIPRYGITTIAGEGGVGKTSLWCAIVASITSGKPSFLTDWETPFERDPENVVVFSAEDSWNYVLKKRLLDNGADMSRILYMGPEDERFVDLNFNGDLLKGIVATNTPDLMVFDPVQAFVPENLRMGDRNAMRKCFSPLIGFGETYKMTSIVIAHANKQSGVWGRKRIADSSDIWDASRSVLMTGIVPNSDGLRYISHEKSNWGKLRDTVIFSLDAGVPVFRNYSSKKDRDFIIEDSRQRNAAPAAEEAKEFILNTLNEHKQMEVSELDELAKAEGISNHALKDAKAALRKDGATHTWSIGNKKDNKRYFITLKDTEKPAE